MKQMHPAKATTMYVMECAQKAIDSNDANMYQILCRCAMVLRGLKGLLVLQTDDTGSVEDFVKCKRKELERLFSLHMPKYAVFPYELFE